MDEIWLRLEVLLLHAAARLVASEEMGKDLLLLP